MAEGKIAKTPKVGEITLPVHLMSYEKDKNSYSDGESYHSDFAFFKFADHISDVSDDDGKELGSVGGTTGGHVFMTRYKPHHDAKKCEWTHVIVDVRDIWKMIEAMLNTKEAKATIAKATKDYPELQKKQNKEFEAEQAKKQKKLEAEETRQLKKAQAAELKLLEKEEQALLAEEAALDKGSDDDKAGSKKKKA